MSTPDDDEAELTEAIERVLRSKSRRKLIVAGPGTGKTMLFEKLLRMSPGSQKSRLVLTFINNLKHDLEETLAPLAKVSTLHAYCQGLLHQQSQLRAGLSAGYSCLPGLASLISTDWTCLRGGSAPDFVGIMRQTGDGEPVTFYLERGDYYDAVDFDDSVFRVLRELSSRRDAIPEYDLLLIDEYQDFNPLENGFVDALSQRSPIVIAGDDDQALYSELRGSTSDFIRALHRGGEYEVFTLPFCMRCPKVIVEAVNDVIAEARRRKKLLGRIDKPYKHFAAAKGADSVKYPKIPLVRTTVQRQNANYFGRYIAEAIRMMPREETEEALREGYPAALVIVAQPYRRQIVSFLTTSGYDVDTKRDSEVRLDRKQGLLLLKENPDSNLGWRVVLEFSEKALRNRVIRKTGDGTGGLVDVVPTEFRNQVMEEAARCSPVPSTGETAATEAVSPPAIKVTSFEGAKGLSAQHVFIVGLHEGELPRDAAQIEDIEVCRFVVGLTRARKSCSLMHTGRFADELKKPSPFLSWVKKGRYELKKIDASYWMKKTD